MVTDGQVHNSPERPRDGVQSLETLAQSRIVLDDLALEGVIHRRIEPHTLDRDCGRAAPDNLVIDEHAGSKLYCPEELLLLVGRAERVGKMHGLGLFAEQVLVILLLLSEGRESEQYDSKQRQDIFEMVLHLVKILQGANILILGQEQEVGRKESVF